MAAWKQFDLFPKSEQSQKTVLGGLCTALTFATILILLVYETALSLRVEVESLIDNTNLDDRVRVNLNITFHSASCHSLSLDLQDVTDAHLEDVQYTIHKLRVYENKHIDQLQAQQIRLFEESVSFMSSVSEINDCYGAQLYDGQQCLTCQDVMLAYSARDWPQPARENVAQCMYGYIHSHGRLLFTENFGKERRGPQFLNLNDVANMVYSQGEGCQFYGHFYVKKVPGNFHIGFHGKGQAAIYLNTLQRLDHTIHSLEFSGRHTAPTKGRYLKTSNPLDGTVHANEPGQDSQYYLKLVEAKYETMATRTKEFYTFTAHEQRGEQRSVLPEVHFKYEFDPLTMHYHSRISSISQLLIAYLGTIGGVFAMSKFAQSWLECLF